MPATPTSHDVTRNPLGRAGRARSVPNQLLFRELNEQIYRRTNTGGAGGGKIDIVCECEHRTCLQLLTLSLERYEAIRRVPTHFVAKPGHTATDDERIVEQHEEFIVVEKVGPSAPLAVRLDPHRRPSDSSPPAPLGRTEAAAPRASEPPRPRLGDAIPHAPAWAG